MNITRKLTEGVGAWLHFEYVCNRSGLFSEKYLSLPIGQVLQSLNSDRVIAEFRHPVLSPLMTGRGRRPEVDFVVCNPYPQVQYAVESKWIGTTTPTIENVMWDLIRLALIARESDATCIFILGGRRSDLDRFFNSEEFRGPANVTDRRALLRVDKNCIHSVPLVPTIPYRVPLLRSLLEPFQNLAFPHSVCTVRSQPFPTECPVNQYQVYAWRIFTKKKDYFFYPKNSRHYCGRPNS